MNEHQNTASWFYPVVVVLLFYDYFCSGEHGSLPKAARRLWCPSPEIYPCILTVNPYAYYVGNAWLLMVTVLFFFFFLF